MIFFFFKQKTAYELRISDWSSDVCSSDLGFLQNIFCLTVLGLPFLRDVETEIHQLRIKKRNTRLQRHRHGYFVHTHQQQLRQAEEIGRASGRERVCQYV